MKHTTSNSAKMLRTVLAGLITLCTALTYAQAPEQDQGQALINDFDDRVLVIVNEDVITQSEFEIRKRALLAEMDQPESELPPEFAENVLEGMISDRLQMQEAERRDLEPSEDEIDFGVQRFVEQQNLSMEQFIKSLVADGQTLTDFRATLKDTIALSRLRDYYARARVIVPDYEIDGFLAVNGSRMNDVQYQVAHLLIKDPVVNAVKAERVRQEIVETGDFAAAVAQYSEGNDAQSGGVMGWRRPEQLPEVFVTALADTPVGGVTKVLESANGLHILKLMDLQGERTEIIQHKATHILISANTEVARAQAAKKLRALRERALGGELFSQLARIHSDDAVSASAGGSLGWVTPGDMVREFEDVMISLPLNEISQPFSSQFGEHIVMVEDRRQKNITEEMMRMRADILLRRQRADREFSQWVRQLRDQAYIEHVVAPTES